MTKIKSIKPKAFWEFFTKKVGEASAVFLTPEMTGLVASTTDNLDAPPGGAKGADKVKREELVVFLKIMVALKSGRPVKLIPSGKTQWAVHYGPKP